MTASNSRIDVEKLPGIGEPTSVSEFPGDSKQAFSPSADYLRLAGGEHTSTHVSSGEVLLFCVIGKLDVTINGQHHDVTANQMIYIGKGLPYRVDAVIDSALLVTTLFSDQATAKKTKPEIDRNNEVDEALEETFPASDPPSYNATTIT
ncbi:cupin domain-containing protein [Bremerella cremea]|uniref:Cupin domain-containing protein n=1 Tax=Bremerella cremea TaxID=1031537 RepID=A0A368KVQ4_9BACT|nr:cupin domain-containing protein [Bremerella cremea]RCS54498.1 cupin domain-containing protein [Bremerella cremea]